MTVAILNIDELITVKRQLTLRGETYDIVEQSVGLMLDSINAIKQADKRRGGKKMDEEEYLGRMLKTLQTIIPECPEHVLRGLTVGQMVAILNFCNEDPNKQAAEAQAEATEAEKAAGETNQVVEVGKA